MNRKPKPFARLRRLTRHLLVVVGAVALTLAFFLVLPLMQTINKPPTSDMMVQQVDVAKLEAPDPPPEMEEPEEEPPPEKPEPELMEDTQPLDLSQLELALNPGTGGGLGSADFTVNLKTIGAESEDVDELFSMADLDQKPRVVYQPCPRLTSEVRAAAPGTVYIIFIVNKDGRVDQPRVQKSTSPIFEKPALDAIKKWKFEPGKRGGNPVRFRMRVPITFPKG